MATPSDIYRRESRSSPALPTSRAAAAPARRNYPAANAPARLVADWASGDLTANQAIFNSLRTMRNRIRQLARENDLCRRFLAVMRAKVIGSEAVGYQAKARDPLSRKLDKVANDLLEAGLRDFSRKGNFTACGSMSRLAAEWQALCSVLVDGEFLARKIRGYPNRHGFALQMLDPAMLDETYNVPAGPGQNAVKLGVEVDGYNRPVAYHLLEQLETLMGMPVSGKRIRVPASEIIHAYLVERPGQMRGVTWLCSVGLRMKLLDGYETAVTVGARAAAAKMGFLVNKDADYQGDVDSAGNPLDGLLTMNAAPGVIEQIPSGLEFQSWDPGSAPATMAEFTEAMKQGIASGVSMSYPTLASNLKGVSYSSIRKGDLDDKDIWRFWQSFMVENVNDAWFRDWLEMSLLVGVVNLPIGKIDKFAEREWWPRTWEGVDPKKTIDEKKGLRELGVSNTTILRELGYDIESEAELIAGEPQTMLPWTQPAPSPSVEEEEELEKSAGKKNGD